MDVSGRRIHKQQKSLAVATHFLTGSDGVGTRGSAACAVKMMVVGVCDMTANPINQRDFSANSDG